MIEEIVVVETKWKIRYPGEPGARDAAIAYAKEHSITSGYKVVGDFGVSKEAVRDDVRVVRKCARAGCLSEVTSSLYCSSSCEFVVCEHQNCLD